MAAAAAAMLAAPLSASAVGGLQGPVFKIDTAPNGDVLVADVSAGIRIVRSEAVIRTLERPGATAVAAIGSRSMWVTTTGMDTTSDSGQALWRVSNGRSRMVANLFELEEADPDGEGVDSNPYDVAALGGGDAALVVDAGGNSLHRIDNDGNAELVATFPTELRSTANFNDLAGCPPEDPMCAIPAPAIPGQSVPTSVVVGPNGDYWVGELIGFPGPTDESGIWRIDAGATDVQCGVDPECTRVFDGGFTSIVDLEIGPDGLLYVSELDERGWAAVEIFGLVTGGTLNACDLATLTCEEVATDVPVHTAVAIDRKGTTWVTRNALTPGGAEVVSLG